MRRIVSVFFLLSSSILLSACSTVSQEIVNKAPEKPQVSPTLTQADTRVLKRKVAIARFSNETRHGNSFLLDENYDRVGKQSMDILSARLVDTGKFLLFERADLGKVEAERKLTDMNVSTVGADYLIVGSVSEFGRKITSEVGVFSRNKKQHARATVNVRLIDVASGQVVFSEEGTGEAMSEANRVLGVGEKAGFDSELDDKALSAAISKLVSNLVENLLDKPWQAYIVGEQDNLFIMTGGKSQGLQVGDEFSVVKRGKKVRNSQTGFMIELPGTEIARVRITQLLGEGNNEVSLCSVTQGSLQGINFDSLVIRELSNQEANRK